MSLLSSLISHSRCISSLIYIIYDVLIIIRQHQSSIMSTKKHQYTTPTKKNKRYILPTKNNLQYALSRISNAPSPTCKPQPPLTSIDGIAKVRVEDLTDDDQKSPTDKPQPPHTSVDDITNAKVKELTHDNQKYYVFDVQIDKNYELSLDLETTSCLDYERHPCKHYARQCLLRHFKSTWKSSSLSSSSLCLKVEPTSKYNLHHVDCHLLSCSVAGCAKKFHFSCYMNMVTMESMTHQFYHDIYNEKDRLKKVKGIITSQKIAVDSGDSESSLKNINKTIILPYCGKRCYNKLKHAKRPNHPQCYNKKRKVSTNLTSPLNQSSSNNVDDDSQFSSSTTSTENSENINIPDLIFFLKMMYKDSNSSENKKRKISSTSMDDTANFSTDEQPIKRASLSERFMKVEQNLRIMEHRRKLQNEGYTEYQIDTFIPSHDVSSSELFMNLKQSFRIKEHRRKLQKDGYTEDQMDKIIP